MSITKQLAGTLLCLAFFILHAAAFPLLSSRDANSYSFAIPAIRKDGYQANGPRAYAHALAKWSANLPGDFSRVATVASGLSDTVAAWNQSYDKEYLSPISVGNPPQEVDVDMDTGSSDCWVFTDKTLIESGLDNVGTRKVFNVSQSTSQKTLNHTNWQVSYGDGSFALGNVVVDAVRIGSIVVNNVNIQTAQQASDSITYKDPVISGIWGLAYDYPSSVEPSTTTFTSALLPQLASEIITVDLKYHANGTYNFGVLDTSSNTTAFNWIPLSDNASYWQASFGGFNVGGHNGTNYWLLHSWPVIFDTGTTLMLLPDDLVAAYYNQINGSNTDPNYGGWTYECPDDYNQIPDLNIGFGNYVVNIPGHMMMYQQVSDLGGAPSNTGNKGPRCFGAIQSNAGLPFSIFGDALLKTQIAAFDFHGKRVGLAQKHL